MAGLRTRRPDPHTYLADSITVADIAGAANIGKRVAYRSFRQGEAAG